MALTVNPNALVSDPTTLAGLRRQANGQSPEALRETARQFESLFTTMMLKSMRDATPGESLFGSEQQDFYQDMFDQQLAVQLSSGKGLGLADMLVRQLMQSAGVVGESSPAAAAESEMVKQPGTAALWPPRSRDDFISTLLPAAREAGHKLGVDPTHILAQAALETGWGQHMPVGRDGQPSFNLFGIKSGSAWQGEFVTSATREFEGGRMRNVDAGFRAYSSPQESIRDYVSFLGSSPRYAQVLGTGADTQAFARGLQDAGYATDPQYATKLGAIARELKSQFAQPIIQSKA
jgi:peptidoglycan hydrolase FlgJ